MTELVKVHLGSGPNILPGWINVDYEPDFNPEVVADLSQAFPFEDQSVDYIHSEGVLCQFNLSTGQHFLNECYRILKPGGVMRLLTPDLQRLLAAYLDDYDRDENKLAELWTREVEIPLQLGTSAEVVNIGVRNLHKFMYDRKTLLKLLISSGFVSKQAAYQESSVSALSGLDVRAPEDATYMYFECKKPLKADNKDLASKPSCPILTYHSPNVYANEYGKNDHLTLENDLKHLQALGKRIIPLATLVDWVLGDVDDSEIENAVCITFDDGCLLDVEELEFPPHGLQVSFLQILNSFRDRNPEACTTGALATSFVIASKNDRRQIDTKSLFGLGWMEDDWWAGEQAEGVIDIQSHGWDHLHNMEEINLEAVVPFERFETVDDFDQCELQVVKANAYIGDLLGGNKPQFFAYPFGSSSAYIRDVYFPENLERTGIRAAFSTSPEHVTRHSNRWDLPRYVCGRDWTSIEQFETILNDALVGSCQ